MSEDIFKAFYDKLPVPVIVCAREDRLPVVYLNPSARMIFTPSMWLENTRNGGGRDALERVFRFQSQEKFNAFTLTLGNAGALADWDVNVLSFQGDIIPVRLDANSVTLEGGSYFVIYLNHVEKNTHDAEAKLMSQMLNAGNSIADVDQAIQSVLQLVGDHACVGRAYIFEEVFPAMTRNTYEWCAPGVLPMIQKMQNLPTSDYNYDNIMHARGIAITHDTSDMPECDRLLLEKRGVHSLAVIPLYHYDNPLGYIGFDNCAEHREWTLEEIQLLKNASSIVASLLNRRNAERQSRRGQEVFRTVTDNLDELVYITDTATHELKFVSKSLARAMRKPVREMLGQPCWRILHRGQNGPCPFCPMPRLLEGDGDASTSYIWELHNSVTGKWYMVKNSLVDWMDGSRVHLSTLVDISYRKQYEEQLRRFAATDAMTDVYNRKWGYGKLEELFAGGAEARRKQTLCFLDMDELKKVNDRLGHAVGDEMILNAIRTVHSCIRKNDFIVRWGGDEFIVFLDCGLADAQVVLEKINFGVEHFNSTQGKPYSLSMSAGMVGFGEQFGSLDDLINEADRRMYANKEAKRGESAGHVR